MPTNGTATGIKLLKLIQIVVGVLRADKRLTKIVSLCPTANFGFRGLVR